ncbi:MAG: hypothetical protein ACK499_03890 [Betaproteobacteria bacterium]|jgi:hypothetical protein
MSAANHHEESSFWPAYVDAITNVMLNILFVVAVFAMALNTVVKDAPKERLNQDMALNTVVKDAPKERLNQDAKSQVKPVQALLQAPQPQEAQPQPLFVKDSTPQGGDKPTGLRWAVIRQETAGEGLMRFDFDPGNSRVSATDASAVRETLRKISTAQAAPQWLIWVSVNTRNAADARHAYLRAMAIRTALIDAGQTPQAIEVRLLDSGQGQQDAGKQTVWLARSQQSSAPAPG